MLQQEQQEEEEEEEEEGEIVEPITYGFAVGKKRTGGAGYRSRYLSHASALPSELRPRDNSQS